jgi:HD-GYP domain-containing protein (c-di-GMP phosphodiesterase class II)
LVLAGLLHDIGKARIPEAIVKKHGKLEPEEYEFMKKHPTLGYNIVKDIPDIKDEIKEAILMHHERKDGTGYPQRVKGDEIGLYAKIISIADVYDAMTSERVYKKRITPFDTFREFESEGYQSFDTKIMLTFLSNIAAYYLGSRVRLDTGETGEIVYLPPQHISRPVIKVGKDRYVDMYRESDRRIVEML